MLNAKTILIAIGVVGLLAAAYYASPLAFGSSDCTAELRLDITPGNTATIAPGHTTFVLRATNPAGAGVRSVVTVFSGGAPFTSFETDALGYATRTLNLSAGEYQFAAYNKYHPEPYAMICTDDQKYEYTVGVSSGGSGSGGSGGGSFDAAEGNWPLILSLGVIAASAWLAPMILGHRAPLFVPGDLIWGFLGIFVMLASDAVQILPASTWSPLVDLGSFAVGTSLVVTDRTSSWPRRVGWLILGIHLAQVLFTNPGALLGGM